ncbi:MAG: two-component regulator propeller domain-containing protein [Balneolaceae bacterium]
MTNKIFTVVFLFVVTTAGLHSQNLEEWQVYPSFSTVNSISVSDNILYSATLGGIFIVENEEIQSRITTMDGLYRANPTAVIFDSTNNRLLAGYVDGTLDVINVETKEIERIEDIKRVTRFNSKSVNALDIYEGKAYISTSFGIVVYDLETLLVENSYLKLGNFNIGTQVNAIDIADSTIYAATIQGVAVGDIRTNLVESTNWQTFNDFNGLTSLMISEIAYFDSKIFVLASDSIYEYQNESWIESPTFTSSNYTALGLADNRENLAVANNASIIILNMEGNTTSLAPAFNSRISALKLKDQQVFAGTSNEGLLVINPSNSTQEQYLPSGPYLNFFSKLLVTQNRVAATSTAAFPQTDPFNPIRGYYINNGDRWENFNQNTSSALSEHRVGSVYSIGQNDFSYFFGSWGRGVVRHNKEDDEITVYNHSNSSLAGTRSSDQEFVVISDLDSDSQNNMWAISYYSEYPLNLQLANSDEWIPFRGQSGSDIYFNLFIDSFDQKWISLITNTNSGRGLFVLDTGNPEDSGDNTGIKLTSSVNNGNLPDEKINAITEDRNGEIWIGTARGIARFIFPEFMIDGGPDERRAQWLINEDTTAASRYLLRDVNVSAIAVNDANQKWVGSENQGIWLLNAEGSRIEKRFTTQNSNLISNNIESIAIDNATGEVYVATELGLISFMDIPQAPVTEMNKLKVFPNPFEYSRHNQIVIEGLSDETRLKILGSDGIVINELTARGGRISWDGFDYNGNQLGSGVYFVVAYEEDGKEKGVGKVVIIR